MFEKKRVNIYLRIFQEKKKKKIPRPSDHKIIPKSTPPRNAQIYVCLRLENQIKLFMNQRPKLEARIVK